MSPPRRMKLYAAGFNPWGQLAFDEQGIQNEPKDIQSFQVILEGCNIDVVTCRLSYTLVYKDSELVKTGSAFPDDERQLALVRDGEENALGEILAAETSPDAQSGALLRRFPDLVSREEGKHSHSWRCEKGIRQIDSYNVGWVILYNDGTVATLGDARFEDCLGREVTDESPAEAPVEVPDLNSLGEPVQKIAAGGYTAAALTESGSLYAWGMRSPGSHHRRQAIPDLNGIPNYVEVDGGKDVVDMAAGESHAITLTVDGCVYVIGGNENGQLGLKTRFLGSVWSVSSWTKVDLGLADGHRVVAVRAGPRASFIVVAIETGES